MTATIKHHDSPYDWCHLCGNRSDTTADVWWASNAEHDRGPVYLMESVGAGRYLRACCQCAEQIARAADPSRPWRDCGLHPDATTEACRSLTAGRPLCDLCAARAAVAMVREQADEAIRERAEAIDEADAAADVALELAHGLNLAHAATHPMHISDPVDSCATCSLLTRARRWAR